MPTFPFDLPAEFTGATTTVLVIDPMGTDIMPYMGSLMRGTINTMGTAEKLPYVNLPGLANVVAGTATLHARLTTGRAPNEKFVVFAYSEGAQVASRWLRLHGPDLDIDPADIEFILIGNATRKYGGFAYHRTVFAAVADIDGYPDNTPYKVTDFVRQYDSIGDFPTGSPEILSALDSISGIGFGIDLWAQAFTAIKAILSNQDLINAVEEAEAGTLVHVNYFDVTLTNPNNVSYTPDISFGVPGNVTYMWSPTNVLPSLVGWAWLPKYQQQLDFAQRESVESNWNRPVALPLPPYNLLQPPPPPPPPPAAPDLYGGEPWKVAEAADALAAQRDFYKKEYVVTIYDKFWRPTGEFGEDMIELSGTDPRNALASATLKVKGGTQHLSHLMKCKDEMVGVTVETGGLRFAFYVDTFDYTYENGKWEGTANLLGIWDILNYLIIWPMWYMPIQAQPISHAIYIWALCTVIENMVAEQSLRIQAGINEFLNNALSLNFDMRTWFGALLQSNGNIFTMLKTPVYVVRTNPLLDTSPLIARTVRMESCGTVIADITKAYGVDVRVDLWLPGDDQPDPWAGLTQPTYVVTAKDRSQIEGPTKTVLDSVLRTVVDLEGSLLGKVLDPLLNPQGKYAPENVFIAPTLGINFVLPWSYLVAPPEGEKGSVVSCKISYHTQKGWQHIIGGRSPKWLNDLMNATYAWLIDSVSILIGFSGIPSNLLEGFLNNAFLAFQLLQHYQRRNDAGPYHPNIETFTATSSSPYNIETLFAFIDKLWDTRGYISAQATFHDGVVYKLGRDVFRGGLMSVVYPGPDGKKMLFTDYIENVMFRITPSEHTLMVQIGDGKAEEAPLAKHERFITGTIESINVITLAPQS